MNRDQKLILLVLVMVMAFTYMTYYTIMENAVAVATVDGKRAYVNLNQWNETEESVKLLGEWAYYEGMLSDEIQGATPEYIELPENRKKQVSDNYYKYGTYMLEVEGLKKNHTYGVFSGSQVTAYNLYVNGGLIMSTGQVGKSIATHISEWKHMSSSFRTDEFGKAQIAVEISNYEYQDGLFWNPIIIGEQSNIFSARVKMVVVNAVLVVTFFAISVALIVVYLRFRLDRSMLLFVLFLMNMIVRLMVTSDRLILLLVREVPWTVMVRLDYLTGYLFLPIFVMFLIELIKSEHKKLLGRVALVYSIITIIGVATTSHELYSSVFFQYLWLAAICLVFLGWRVAVYFKGSLFHTWVMFMVLGNILLSIINQIFGGMVSYVPVAMLNVIIGLTVVLGIRVMVHIRKNDLLAFSAMIDQLTGLYNRKYIQEIEANSPIKNNDDSYYILFMDLDGFKKVNDEYGHEEGDQVLQIVSQRFRGCLRESDVLLRYGGDEFIIIAKADERHQVEELAQRIIERITRNISHEGKVHQVGISIGISECGSFDMVTIDQCIKCSDGAMYKAKKSGGNQYVYS